MADDRELIVPAAAGRLLGLMFCALPVIAQGLDFTPTELPWAVVDEAYKPPPLLVKGGGNCHAGEATFTAASELPEGISITGVGQFGGVPRKTGTYNFKLRIADPCSAKVRDMTLVVTGAPILVISATSLEFHYTRNGPPPEPQAVLVRSTWPDLAYSVESHEVPWLRATAAKGRVPRIGAPVDADRVTVRVTPASLAPGSYEASLTFWAWQGANTPTIKIRLTVE
jgi:hypothetical protein